MLVPALNIDAAVRVAPGRSERPNSTVRSTSTDPFLAMVEPGIPGDAPAAAGRWIESPLNALLIRQMAEALVPKNGLLGGKATLASDVSRTMFVDAVASMTAAGVARPDVQKSNLGASL